MPGFEKIIFETPLALLLLLLVPCLVAVHYFQRERVLVKASAFFLWREIFEEVKPKNTWMQIFRNLLLLFHLLFILAITLAVSNPHFNRVNFSGKNAVLLIDNSASMNTLEHGGTRLEQAKKAALVFVGQEKNKSFIVIPVVGETPQTLLTDNISTISATDASGNIDTLLDDIYSSQKNTPAIFYFGDANTETTKKALLNASGVVIVPIGEAHENLGIANLSSRFIPEINDKREVRVVVENFGNNIQKSQLQIHMAEQMVFEKDISLLGGESKSFAVKVLPESSGILKASLTAHDSYMQDNVAYNIVSGFSPVKTVFVSDSYPSRLLSAIRIQKGVDVNLISSKTFITQYLVKQSDDVGDSVGIFYKFLPEKTPFKNNIYIDPWNSSGDYSSSNNMTWDRESPIVENLYFNAFFIPSFSNMPMKNIHSILRMDGKPIIFSGENGKNLFFAFDAEISGFSSQPAFPIFMRKIFLYFRSSCKKNIKTGDIFSMPVGEGHGDVQVLDPYGQKVPFELVNGNLSVLDTYHSGVYTVITKNKKIKFAAQQHSIESAISPGTLGKQFMSKRVVPKNMLSMRESFMERWKVCAIFALLLLLCEWWYQKKGIYALY